LDYARTHTHPKSRNDTTQAYFVILVAAQVTAELILAVLGVH